ncbi:MAG: hemolysin III [Alcanivorax sp.]|jgi:hemolysin III
MRIFSSDIFWVAMYYGEKLNSMSHLVGTVFSLVGLGALITVAVQSGDPWKITSFTIFGLTLVLLYTTSTLYHSFQPPKLKRLFKVLDHIAIYLLIAGTYTPFMVVTLREANGVEILSVVWILAIVGSLTEIFLSGRIVKVGQLIIYLGMGWSCVYDFDALKAALSQTGFDWLFTGGLAYTAGAVFYILDKLGKLNHAHGIWHIFVLAGSICHFIAVLLYV